MLVIVGIIHLLPLPGAFGADRLTRLYGLALTDTSLVLLMRHRAVLFGMLGLFLLFAAFRPSVQPMALTAGFISIVSFLWLAWPAGAHNAQIARVFDADVFALGCLLLAAGAYLFTAFRSQ